MDAVAGEEGEGEMYGEKNTEIYSIMCKTQKTGICCMTQGTQTGALRQAEGWGREGDGREGTWVYLWLILVDV